MKLHLPKLLRNSVLACITAVAGIATTTVGTATFTGGVVAFALAAAPQALADYTWIGGTGTATPKTQEDWDTASNWNLGGESFNTSGKGPGMPGSNLWNPIRINGGTEGVQIGTADARIGLEGWQPRLILDSKAVLYADINKFQASSEFTVTNGSILNMTHEGGQFRAATFNVGAGSSIVLNLTTSFSNEMQTINLNAADATMTIAHTGDLGTLTGPVTVNASLADIDEGTLGVQNVGLILDNVAISGALTFNFGSEWTLSETEITEANKAENEGKYYVYAEAGVYKVVYSQRSGPAWHGGALSWGADTVFSNGYSYTAGCDVAFSKADAAVTVVADVSAGRVKVKDGIKVSIGGEHTLTAETVSIGENAQLSILKGSAVSLGAVSMKDSAQLNIATGGETTVQDVLGSATWTGGAIGVTNGTTVSLADAVLNDSNIVVDASTLKVSNVGTDSGKVYLAGDVKLQNNAVMEFVEGAGADGFNYGNANKIEILGNSELRTNNNRLSLQASDEIILNNGKITGTGDSNGVLDFFEDGAVVVSNGTSSIAGSIRLRTSGATTTFQVDSGTLTISDFKNSQGNLAKTGAGTMIITGATNYPGTTTVNGGELILQATGNTGKGAITLGAGGTLTIAESANQAIGSTISGAGTLNLNGTLTINLASYTTLAASGGAYSDGENGYAEGLLVATVGTVNKGANGSVVVIDGETTNTYTSADINVSGGNMFVGSSDGTYYINTDVTYDAAKLGEVTGFCLTHGAAFRTADASVLSKTTSIDSTGTVYLSSPGSVIETAASASTYKGNVVITSGTEVKVMHKQALGVEYSNNATQTVTVEDGAVLDVNGKGDVYYSVVLEQGATLANKSTSGVGIGNKQNPRVTLNGDATIDAQGEFGIVGSGYGTSYLTLNGHTLTKTGGSIFNLWNTSLNAGTIDIQGGHLRFGIDTVGLNEVDLMMQAGTKMSYGSNGDTARDKNVKSLTIYQGSSTGDVELEQSNSNVSINITGSTSAATKINKTGAGSLTLSGTNTLGGGLTVTAGTLTLNGATTLGGTITIESGATLALGENVTVTLSSLAGFTASDATLPTTNGLVTGSTYKIVDNKNADNANNGLTSVLYNGETCTLGADGTISAGAKIYYAVEAGDDKVVTVGGSSPTADTANATEFYVGENGTLKIAGNASDSLTADQVLATTTGDGTIVLASTVGVATGTSIQFAGKLSIGTGGALNFNPGKGAAADMSNVTAVEFDGGTVNYNAAPDVWNSVSVTTNGGTMNIQDHPDSNTTPIQFTGVTSLAGDLTINTTWKSYLNIEQLTGAGDLILSSTGGNTDGLGANTTVGVTNGFTGNIDIRGKAANKEHVTVDVGSGCTLAASRIIINDAAGVDVKLSGSGTYTNGDSLALAGGISLAEGWKGTVAVTGANVTSTVDASALANSSSTLAISGLTVADGAALTLGGNVSLGGTVSTAESLVNNGSITFGSDLVLDLTGMTITDGADGSKVITLLTGAGTSNLASLTDSVLSAATKELGSDWTFNSNGTISFVAAASNLFWEGTGATGNWSDTKWATTDGGTADQSFAANSNVTFSGATEATTITVDTNATVGTMTVSGAAYTFNRKDGTESIITAKSLVIGENASAIFGLNAINTGALTSVTVAEGGVMELAANARSAFLNLAAVTTGDGTVKLAGHADLGDDSEISLSSLTESSITTAVNFEISNNVAVHGGGEDKTLIIAKGFAVGNELRMESSGKVKVVDGGNLTATTISLGHSTAGHPGHLEITGGKVTAGTLVSTNGHAFATTANTFKMSGGTLELTTSGAEIKDFQSTITGGTLKASEAVSWGVTGATIGGATIETGTGTITVKDSTLTGALSNTAGNLVFSGTINLDTTNYTPAATSVAGYSEGANGYQRTDSVYSLVNTVGKLTVSDVTWQVNGSTEGVSYADGAVTLAGTYGTEFYLRTINETYSNLAGADHAAMTAVVLDGGGLNLNQALKSGVTIKVQKEGESVVDVANGVTLASTSVTSDATHKMKLHGAGTYALADGVSTLGDGVGLGDWTGTVKLTNVSQANGKMNISAKLNPLANASSSVTVTNVKGYLDTGNTLTANLVLVNAADGTSAISITNGNSDATSGERKAEITGSVSGDGDISFSTWEGINNRYVTYAFTGEITGWTGSFVNNGTAEYSGYANVIIAGDTEINASVVNDADRYTGSKLYLTIGGESDVTMNGAVNVDKLTVNQNTSFTNTVAATDMVIAAAASVTNDLSLTTLNNTGSLTATEKSITVTGAVTGTGSMSAGALTLQAATNTVGALTLSGDLTLGTAEATSSLTATSLTMGATDSSVVLNKLGTNLLTVGTLGSALNVSITDALLEAMIQDGTSSLELMTLTDIGSYELSLNGETAGYDVADGQYLLKLDRDATTGVVTLVVASQGSVWGGNGDDADNLWSSATNWNDGIVPGEDESIVFDGRGSSTVVVNGEINVENLTFATNTDTTEVPEPVTEYTLEAGEGDSLLLVNRNLAVNNGSTVNVATEVAITSHTRIAKGATLTVNEGGTLLSQNGIENNGIINNNYYVTIGTGVSVSSATNDTLTNNGTFNNNAEGVLTVGKDIINSGTLNNAGVLSAAGLVENSGSIAVTDGTVTIGVTGTADDVTSLDNDSSIAVSGGVVTINGSVDNDGTITISGTDKDTLATVKVNGNLDNTNGTITIGSAAVADNPDTEDDETAAATYGSLTVTGDLTGTGATDKLTVEEGSSLAVGGDLTALENVELAFGGDITVGGNVNISTLTNNGTFKTTSTADDASVEIGTLKGSGELNVAGGTLYIGSQVDFTGSLTGNGKLVAGAADGEAHDFTMLTKQDAVTATDMATDIAADSLTVSGRWMKDGEVVDADTEGAVWDSANGSILGDVAANSIVIDVLDDAASPHLKLNSLTGKLDDADTDTTVEITLTELGSSEGVQDLIAAGEKTYHLLSIAGSTTDLKLTDNLSDADEQLLWKSGLKLGELQTSAVMALRAAGTDVSISVLEQTLAEATWDTAGDTTKIGLDLGTLTNGTMVLHSNDMLDNVKSVNVTADTELDLSGSDDDAVNINGLTGEKNLTISGNGDTVNVTTAVKQDDDTTLAGKYDGALVLSDVAASVSGQYGSNPAALGSGTLEKNGVLVGEDATAELDVKDSKVVLDGGSLSGDSAMDGGALAVKSTNAAIVAGNIMVDTGNKLSIKNGTDIAIVGEATDSMVLDVQGTGKHVIADLGTVDGTAGDVAIVDEQNKSIAVMDKYFTGVRLENGKVVADRNTSYYSDKADESLSANGAAGMQMADAAMVVLNPQATAPQGDLAGVLNMLDTATGAAADELGASLAGASTAVLGMATMGDVDRQLQAIRNRTTTMGVDQSVANEDMPYFNAWINAEGDRSELSESGTEGGYELSSWGGTVGFDVDLCPTFTAGMALTAMYGDIDTTGADKASGNIDTYYVTAFARYAPSAWTHTFVATVGMSDISLDRHVAGAEVEGETDGLSFGLMYEVGRVFALDEDGSTCLQPVFNVTWKHTAIDAYTEDGSDLALEVDEQTLDTVTFGLGARLQTVVGESMYNRTSILEARVLAKADVGDRSGSSDVALSALPGTKASVDSAEMGAFGLEAGAGLTIPVGDEGGSIFMDASVELRSDYTNVNGTVGYRINF